MKLNEKIYILRKQFGWSQDELAERLVVSRRSVSKWETGDTVPEPAKLISLAKIFSVSVDYLLDESQQEYIPPQAKESIDIADKVMRKFESLFKNYGWILGLILLVGLWRTISAVASIATCSVAGTFHVLGGVMLLPMALSLLTGLAIAVCGIILMKRLRKKKNKNN